jgi:DNA-binding beta-propeller fold protein YncE
MRPRHLIACGPLLGAALLASAASAAAPVVPAPSAATAATTELTAVSIALPGGPPVGMDYLAYDPATARLWIPAGNTARVDVLDTRTGTLSAVDGFATEKRGERTAGPSSAAVGEGQVYVGNRAGSQVCAIDAKTLARRGCVTLASSPDGLQYIAATHELWVTTPRDRSVTVLDLKDPAAPVVSGKIAFEGEPEGYAADQARGLFFTNLEDGGTTLTVDVRTRKVIATWRPECSEKGPRGLALDAARGLLFVACADGKVKSFTKDGAIAGTLDLGGGIDNIDYHQARHLLYAASAREGNLVVASVSDSGGLQRHATAKTTPGGRSVFVDGEGTAYVPDSAGARLLVVKLPR